MPADVTAPERLQLATTFRADEVHALCSLLCKLQAQPGALAPIMRSEGLRRAHGKLIRMREKAEGRPCK